jgi:hypothetical protein
MNKAQRKLMRAVRKLRILRLSESSYDRLVGYLRPDDYLSLVDRGLVDSRALDNERLNKARAQYYKDIALHDIATGTMYPYYVYFKYNREFAEEWNLKLYR